ncbi:uncharacterized protein LOC114533477 isoform X6 [Dendronephthya gigantea]|uniref:uncharacterized protein LOC114533477 isoform X6 n=1 Tax=Dendronephthya gigantea TaxID=151771 RepID=UPI00106CD5F5|nr:uncharacterized protein LOC114533477 isoform X6 [Dendronephthya gigantea]
MEDLERSLHDMSLDNEGEKDIGLLQQAVLPTSDTTESRTFSSDEKFDCVAMTMTSTSKKEQHSEKQSLTPESKQHNEPIAKIHQSSDSCTSATDLPFIVRDFIAILNQSVIG